MGYEGGIIAPGVNFILEALYMAASRLPRIKVDNTKNINVIGKNTKDSMYSGIYWGYISLIEGLVKRINEEKNFNYYVIATGGLSNLFSKTVPIIEKVDNELTLNGLIHIYNINKKLKKYMKIEKDFIFLPLGGSSEIGMNSNLYHYEDNWIMVDLGISFADETMPGVDILLPDIDFIVQRRDKLKGIFLTHGQQEDHMGAIQYIWDNLEFQFMEVLLP